MEECRPAPECYFRDKRLAPRQGHEWASHQHDVVTLVLRGRLDEEFDSETQFCDGWQLHYKPAGVMHRTVAGPEGVRMFLVGIGPADRRNYLFPQGLRPMALRGGVAAARALTAFLRLQQEDPARNQRTTDTVREIASAFHSVIPRQTAPRPSWITEVHEQVMTRFDGEVGLGQLAASFHVHSVYLARAFRKHYGVSIGSLRRRARSDRAVDRLTQTRGSLAELAFELGYADQSHFTREFKKETGWSPGQFRDRVSGLAQRAS